MTAIPNKKDWPKWAIDAFIHEGDVVYKNEHGQVKKKNGHFVKGFSGNVKGLSSSHAQQILRIRSMCLEALETKGLPRLFEAIQDDETSVRDIVAIVKFLSETSIPRQVEDTTEDKSNIPQIIISRDAIDRAEELDKQYNEESSNLGDE